MGEDRDMKYRNDVMEDVTIIGTTDKLPIVTSRLPESGRFLLPFDVKYKKNVVVIGTTVAEGLFGQGSPLNKEVLIGPAKFRVVGVLEKQGRKHFRRVPTSTGRSSYQSPLSCGSSAAVTSARSTSP